MVTVTRIRRGSRRNLLTILRAVGILIAGYLTWVHYQPTLLTCPSGGLWHCARVLHSAGSTLGPVPLATVGGLWLLAAWLTDHAGPWRVRPVLMVSGSWGLGWAWGYEWHLHALCVWCTLLQGIILIQLAVWSGPAIRHIVTTRHQG